MERLIGTEVPCPDEALPHAYGAHKSGGRKPAEFYTYEIQNSKSNIPHLPICLTIKSKNFILGLQYSEFVVYSLPNCWAILPMHHSKQHQNQDNHYEEDRHPRPYGRRFRVLPAAAAAADSPGGCCSPAGGSCEGQVSDS